MPPESSWGTSRVSQPHSLSHTTLQVSPEHPTAFFGVLLLWRLPCCFFFWGGVPWNTTVTRDELTVLFSRCKVFVLLGLVAQPWATHSDSYTTHSWESMKAWLIFILRFEALYVHSPRELWQLQPTIQLSVSLYPPPPTRKGKIFGCHLLSFCAASPGKITTPRLPGTFLIVPNSFPKLQSNLQTDSREKGPGVHWLNTDLLTLCGFWPLPISRARRKHLRGCFRPHKRMEKWW